MLSNVEVGWPWQQATHTRLDTDAFCFHMISHTRELGSQINVLHLTCVGACYALLTSFQKSTGIADTALAVLVAVSFAKLLAKLVDLHSTVTPVMNRLSQLSTFTHGKER